MDIDDISEIIKEEVSGESSVQDNGIGYYEYGSASGFDSQVALEIEVSEVVVDVTDLEVYDEDGNQTAVTFESVTANEGGKFNLTISKSGGGDADSCAESGRKQCGSCDACSTWETDFKATLLSVKQMKNKAGKDCIIAVYKIED